MRIKRKLLCVQKSPSFLHISQTTSRQMFLKIIAFLQNFKIFLTAAFSVKNLHQKLPCLEEQNEHRVLPRALPCTCVS